MSIAATLAIYNILTALSNHKTHTKNQGLSTQHKFQPKHKRKVNEIENDKGKKSNKNQNRKQQTNYEFFTNHRVSAFFLRAVFSSLVISVVVLVTGIVNDAWLIDDVIVPSSIDRFSCSALKMCFFFTKHSMFNKWPFMSSSQNKYTDYRHTRRMAPKSQKQ